MHYNDVACFDPMDASVERFARLVCGPAPPTEAQKTIYALAYGQVNSNPNLMGPGVPYQELAQRSW